MQTRRLSLTPDMPLTTCSRRLSLIHSQGNTACSRRLSLTEGTHATDRQTLIIIILLLLYHYYYTDRQTLIIIIVLLSLYYYYYTDRQTLRHSSSHDGYRGREMSSSVVLLHGRVQHVAIEGDSDCNAAAISLSWPMH